VPTEDTHPVNGKVLADPDVEYNVVPELFTIVVRVQLVPLYERKSVAFVYCVAPFQVALGAAQGT